MSILAMKQAVKALETDPCKENAINNAQFFIKQAIAEAEKQEPVAWVENLTDPQPHAVTDLKYCSVAQRESGEDLKYVPLYTAPVHAGDISQERVDETAKRKHEWVGLEEEEILKCFDSVALGQVEGDCVIDKHVNIFNAIRAIEAKLKEKNT